MQRVAVIAKLKPNSADRARELIEKGPPFDPEKLDFERHYVYLSDEHAVFVFEGARVNALVRMVAGSGVAAEALADWESILDGIPRIAREAYAWERPREAGWVGSYGE